MTWYLITQCDATCKLNIKNFVCLPQIINPRIKYPFGIRFSFLKPCILKKKKEKKRERVDGNKDKQSCNFMDKLARATIGFH
jgi:hypothetical protein